MQVRVFIHKSEGQLDSLVDGGGESMDDDDRVLEQNFVGMLEVDGGRAGLPGCRLR